MYLFFSCFFSLPTSLAHSDGRVRVSKWVECKIPLSCLQEDACETGLVQYEILPRTKYCTGNGKFWSHRTVLRPSAKPRGSLLDMTIEEVRVVGGRGRRINDNRLMRLC
ncbi:hypothetical protein F4805DRAFT_452273 [Annulohypoxylon moriforme]|nr:hypothetical protein F4805DRAFT_452273 [Annulohypoxylon moriforme]